MTSPRTLGGWRVAAHADSPAELWSDVRDQPVALRKRLDATLRRLRDRLREHDVRTDLVRASGAGHFELMLRPTDRVEDQT